jgi:hypothetical protein
MVVNSGEASAVEESQTRQEQAINTTTIKTTRPVGLPDHPLMGKRVGLHDLSGWGTIARRGVVAHVYRLPRGNIMCVVKLDDGDQATREPHQLAPSR